MRKNKSSISLKDRIGIKKWEGMIYPTLDSGINEWRRIDKDCKNFVDTWSNGPGWNQIISRTTYDIHTGKIIDHLVFNETTSQEDLDRKLPGEVNWIKTVILFKVK